MKQLNISQEEADYYWQEVGKIARFHCGRFYYPKLFGVPAHDKTFLPLIKASPRPRAIRVGFKEPPCWMTEFQLCIRKQRNGGFCLTLIVEDEPLCFTTEPTAMSWTEFALLMEFALTHGRVLFVPVLEMLVVEQCFGIRAFELIH